MPRKPKAVQPANDADFDKVFAQELDGTAVREVMEENEASRPYPPKPVNSLAVLADSALFIQRHRVALQVRLSHLERDGRTDPDTQDLISRLQSDEKWVTVKLANKVTQHPTYAWWSQVSGLPANVIAKIIGEIEIFGCWYPVGDPMIPPHVNREPVKGNDGNMWVWVEGIERLTTPSKLIKYAGYAPGQRAEVGKKLDHNRRLKTLGHLLCQFGIVMKQNRYNDFYKRYKSWKSAQLENQGVQVVSTPMSRWCITCRKAVTMKAARFCPTCQSRLENKKEGEGVIFKGHLDAMCRRRVTKLFLCHLWLVWRKALNLPTRAPYAIEKMGHEHATFIRPEQMVG